MIIGLSGYIGCGKDTVGMILQALTMDGRWKNVPLEYVTAYEGRPNLKGGWQIKKFAGKLKQIANLLTGIPVEKFEDQEFKKSYLGKEWNFNETYDDFLLWAEGKPMTVRTFLQRLGTEGLRTGLHENVWVNALFADYQPNSTWDKFINEKGEEVYKFPEPIHADYPNWIITDVRFPNEAQAIKDKGGVVVRIERQKHTGLGEFPMPLQKLHPSETSLDDWKFDYVINNNGTLEQLLEATKTLLNNLKD